MQAKSTLPAICLDLWIILCLEKERIRGVRGLWGSLGDPGICSVSAGQGLGLTPAPPRPLPDPGDRFCKLDTAHTLQIIKEQRGPSLKNDPVVMRPPC